MHPYAVLVDDVDNDDKAVVELILGEIDQSNPPNLHPLREGHRLPAAVRPPLHQRQWKHSRNFSVYVRLNAPPSSTCPTMLAQLCAPQLIERGD